MAARAIGYGAKGNAADAAWLIINQWVIKD